MKKIKSLAVFAVFLIAMLAACSDAGNKIVGVWVVENVALNADTTGLDSKAIKKSIDEQKKLSLEFFADTTMNIISEDGTFPGKWSLNKTTEIINVKLDDYTTKDSVKIGKFANGKIVNREKTAFGWIVITYEKE